MDVNKRNKSSQKITLEELLVRYQKKKKPPRRSVSVECPDAIRDKVIQLVNVLGTLKKTQEQVEGLKTELRPSLIEFFKAVWVKYAKQTYIFPEGLKVTFSLRAKEELPADIHFELVSK
ncbi:MAG: hypothetical protein QXI58_07635 [Candidatus Micrarchaeia archaeon]